MQTLDKTNVPPQTTEVSFYVCSVCQTLCWDLADSSVSSALDHAHFLLFPLSCQYLTIRTSSLTCSFPSFTLYRLASVIQLLLGH